MRGDVDLRELVAGLQRGEEPRIVLLSEAGRGRRLAVLPSAFNPPTLAHLGLVEAARGAAEEVMLLVDLVNADKGRADPEELALRLEMLRRCVDGASVGISSHGLFVDKLRALRALRPGARVTFVVGGDTLRRVLDPRYYADPRGALRELFGGAEFLVARRGPDPAVPPEFRERVRFFDLPPELRGVSSTEARRRARAGLPLGGLVPPAVERFIQERGLYR